MNTILYHPYVCRNSYVNNKFDNGMTGVFVEKNPMHIFSLPEEAPIRILFYPCKISWAHTVQVLKVAGKTGHPYDFRHFEKTRYAYMCIYV